MDLIWTEQLSVGNAILDSDHKELFELAKSIDSAAKARDRPTLTLALKQFRACMGRHFLNEELFAHTLNIPFVKHRQDHQNMQAEIDLTMQEMEKNSLVAIYVIEHYAQFLRDWLTKHLAEEDMPMKSMLQARPYDFKIDGVSL